MGSEPPSGRRSSAFQLPGSLALVAVAALVMGYVPLTGLDHLHLHIDHGLKLFHDHLHIGHHEHAHPGGPLERHHPADPCDERELGSAVVSLGQAAQVRPPAVVLTGPTTPLAGRSVPPAKVESDTDLQYSRTARGPPTNL